MKILKNKIKLACAGSGKTWGICNDAKETTVDKKILFVTYTNKGVASIVAEYKKQNMGVLDKHIEVITWYQFLLRELIKPYQTSFLIDINTIKSYNYDGMYGAKFIKKGTKSYFLTNNNDVKANNASEFAIELNELSNGAVIKRLEEVYSTIYIDELQDLAGRDIELLELLLHSSIKIYCVGDYKQSTLKTHNAKANRNKTGMYIFDYLKSIQGTHSIEIIEENTSRRFGAEIAKFANLIYPSNPIVGVMTEEPIGTGVFQIDRKDIEKYMIAYSPTVLRYDKKTDTMDYPAFNFGVSKGMSIDRVLIFPNGPLKQFLKNPDTKMKSAEKYFVGVTRARYSLVFVVDKFAENRYFKNHEIDADSHRISVLKFVSG
ncbi:UvrD-helicase domain-containing protein [Listeria fleischmannii]|uniref:UvrD-helicase domain-containing protein n=1 Tax=Listeria fleischmannii TaxID=1069827 RepID=UPI0016282E30|nr:UvrD-helicase domain-containing protein [Listeria fleischmannii]MBC1419344.1 UvrD-helicase domain-containing protein [Listeria fleischmannii]